jgi:hypothetical protein
MGDCETNMDAFQKMMKTVMDNKQVFNKVKFQYQRGLELGKIQKRRTEQVFGRYL